MAAVAGKNAIFKVGTATIAGLKEGSVKVNGELIDVTTFASGGWIEKIQGLKSAEIQIKGYYDNTDTTGQVAIRTAYMNGTAVTCSALLDGTTGWTGSFMVKSIGDGANVTGEVTRDITLDSTGAVTTV